MSSNLLKHQYVVNEQSAKRIINSNDRIEEKMRELIQVYQLFDNPQPGSNVNNEFVEGLQAETVSDVPEIDTAALIDEARAEAERIVAEAKAQAEQLLLDANSKAERIYEEQKQAGYQEGASIVEQELSEKMEQLQTEMDIRSRELENEYQQKFDMMESDLIDVIIRVFNNVFHIQYDGKKDILVHLINSTLMNVDSGKHFRIRVSDANWKYVDDKLEELREQLGTDVTIEVTRDIKMSDSDCQIETEFGIFDCGIDLELDGLCRDIRSICAQS